MRGRKPKPTVLKILAGNPGRRPLNSTEPQPTRGIPTMPTCLNSEAKAEWKRITPELDRLGLLTIVDRAALTYYCLAHSQAIAAANNIEKNGVTIDVDVFARESGDVVGSRTIVNPAVKIHNDAIRIAHKFLAEFGLTPATRSRLKAPKVEDNADGDPIQAILNKSQGNKNKHA